jgi:hypothetical protein
MKISKVKNALMDKKTSLKITLHDFDEFFSDFAHISDEISEV